RPAPAPALRFRRADYRDVEPGNDHPRFRRESFHLHGRGNTGHVGESGQLMPTRNTERGLRKVKSKDERSRTRMRTRTTFRDNASALSRVLPTLLASTSPFILAAMKLEDIIRDIHGLEAELVAMERQYGLLSADFYPTTVRVSWSNRAISFSRRAAT